MTDVPLSRVQAIDIVDGPLQRLFGVRGVQVQTAGGSRQAEIMLPAVSPSEVELLRDALRGRGAPAERAPLAERRLGRQQLLFAALTAGQVGVLLPLLAVVAQLSEELGGGDIESASRERMRLVPDSAPEWLLAGVAVVLVAWLMSAVGAVLAFAGFTITRDGDRLRVRRGLLARREATVPVARVQAVRVVEGVLRAPFGLATVRAEVAGYAARPRPRRRSSRCCAAPRSSRFSSRYCRSWRTGSTACASRRAARCAGTCCRPPRSLVTLGGAACFVFPDAAPWPLLAAPPAAAYGAACWRAAGWRLDDRRLAIRFRRVARTTVLAPAARLQQHSTRQTVLQRRAGLADVEVRVGAATCGRVRHLDTLVAGQLFDGLRREEVVSATQPSPVSRSITAPENDA